MDQFLAIIIVVIGGIVGLAVLLWAVIEFFNFIKWIFPTNKDDEKGPFRDKQ